MDFGMSVLRNMEMERKSLKQVSAMIPKQMVRQPQVSQGGYILRGLQHRSARPLEQQSWGQILQPRAFRYFPAKERGIKNIQLLFHTRNDDFPAVSFTKQQRKKRMNKSSKPCTNSINSKSVINDNNCLHKENDV